MNYKVKTHSTTYNFIKTWREWDVDENFIEFIQFYHGKDCILILPKNQILAIYT